MGRPPGHVWSMALIRVLPGAGDLRHRDAQLTGGLPEIRLVPQLLQHGLQVVDRRLERTTWGLNCADAVWLSACAWVSTVWAAAFRAEVPCLMTSTLPSCRRGRSDPPPEYTPQVSPADSVPVSRERPSRTTRNQPDPPRTARRPRRPPPPAAAGPPRAGRTDPGRGRPGRHPTSFTTGIRLTPYGRGYPSTLGVIHGARPRWKFGDDPYPLDAELSLRLRAIEDWWQGPEGSAAPRGSGRPSPETA